MRTTVGRISILAAFVFVLVAIAAQFASLHHAGLGMTTIARAFADKGTAEKAKPIARWHAERSGFWGGLGLGSALLAVVSWFVARKAGQTAPRLVFPLLLIAYALMAMVVV